MNPLEEARKVARSRMREEITRERAALEAEGFTPDVVQVKLDALIYGVGYLVKGKRVDPETVMVFKRPRTKSPLYSLLPEPAKAMFCPECGAPCELDDNGYRDCVCGWTDEPTCAHGIRESEYCPHCPSGGV